MRAVRTRRLWWLLVMALIATACTSGDGTDDSASGQAGGGGGTVSESCAAAADVIVTRLDTFLEPFGDLSPSEFLERPELPGLDTFQNDIAETILDVVRDPNDDCNEADLGAAVDAALLDYADEGLLPRYLVGKVRSGTAIERRDVMVSPADDLLAILPFLGPGSTVQLSEGTFTIDATLLVQSEVTVVGAGVDATFLDSTAPDAAAAVLGDGHLILSELTVRHVGDAPASVLLAVDAPLTLQNVRVSGAVTDTEGGGGSGVVVTGIDTPSAAADTSDATATDGRQSTISNSEITDNDAAGVAVTGAQSPAIFDSRIAGNGQCGICYFDQGAGTVSSTTLEGNGIGIQASDASTAEVFENMFVRNEVAGILIEATSAVTIVSNTFDAPGTVGIDVQGTATPTIRENTFGPHAVGISLRGESTAAVEANTIGGGDIGILVGGAADPEVSGTTVSDTVVSGLLHTESSTGTFTTNNVAPTEGAAVVVEGTAAPTYVDNTLEGGAVGFVFRERSSGNIRENQLENQEVGIEAGDDSFPELVRNTFTGTSAAGLIFSGAAKGEARENRFIDQASIAIQTGGSSSPLIKDNVVEGGDTGALITETSSPRLVSNTFNDQNFAIGVSGQATPEITDNDISGSLASAVSYEGESGGQLTGNVITEAGIAGIRVAGTAAPLIDGNDLFAAPPPQAGDAQATVTPGAGDVAAQAPDQSGVGLLYAEDAKGTASNNNVFGFVIGVQVGDTAAPELLTNRIDGAAVGGVGILYSGGAGRAEGNESLNQQIGFQLSGTSSPELVDNVVGTVGAASFLIQGSSKATLSGNRCETARPGIVVLEQAAPELSENACPVA